MTSKRSKHELKRLVEKAIAQVCGFPQAGLWLCVNEIESSGWPAERLRVWATLHFSSQGSPFCCGEPGCHLWLFGERLGEVSDLLRRDMGLEQALALELHRIATVYHAGVAFKFQRQNPCPPRGRPSFRQASRGSAPQTEE